MNRDKASTALMAVHSSDQLIGSVVRKGLGFLWWSKDKPTVVSECAARCAAQLTFFPKGKDAKECM